MTHPRPAIAGALLVALVALASGIPTASAQGPAPTPEATIGIPGTDGWGPAGAPVPTKGRIPDDAIGADGEIDLDKMPVYGGDLRTLVGFMFDGKGFVPLGVDPASIPGSPAGAAPWVGPSTSPGPLAAVDPPSVWNDTSLTITVAVDGETLQDIPPATLATLAVTGPPPWYVEVRAPDGFRLATGYIAGISPMGYRTDLSCGRIDITWRTVVLGPMNGPGRPGDCGPSVPAGSLSPVATNPVAGDGTAELVSTSARTVRVGGSGSGLIAFGFDEVGGVHHVGPLLSSDCKTFRMRPGVPRSSSLTKSGGFGEGASDAPFLRDFLNDPQVHLPVGTWDISAIASFVEGAGCESAPHRLTAAVRITVSP